MSDYSRYRAALEREPLPAAIVDMDAVDANIAALLAPLKTGKKTLRLATKSVRCPALFKYILDRGAPFVRGLMTYTATETAFLAAEGHRDLLLAYPTAQLSDAELLADVSRKGATAAVIVDDVAHLGLLDACAREKGTRVPVVLDIDLSYRPIAPLHLGVRRSPLRTAADVVALARRVSDFPGLTFHGLMGYEAQIAGVADHGPTPPIDGTSAALPWRGQYLRHGAMRAMKALSRKDVERTRAEIARELTKAGLAPTLFNGGGTGSVASAVREDALTEVTAGSGFLDSHLFDHYRGLTLVPAVYFALQAVRRPAPHIVTCHGGGFIASGEAGPSRLPIPALPHGLRLLPLEGAGEVQTPVACAEGVAIALGDPVFFRHAKAGELAEHFNEYLLVRGDRIVERVKTYRGLGHCFLG